MIKKLLLLSIAFCLLLPALAKADTPASSSGSTGGTAAKTTQTGNLMTDSAAAGGYEVVGVGGNTIFAMIGLVIKTALSLVGTIFLVLTVYAGILWMTAGGNEDQVERSQKIVKASVIGLFIVMSAYAITFFVTNRMKSVGTPIGNQNVDTQK